MASDDNTTTSTQAEPEVEAQAAEASTTDEQTSDDESQEEPLSLEQARKLRSEAKNLRERLREAESTLGELTEAEKQRKRDADKAEEDRLKEQNEWKDLADRRADRLLELEPLEGQVETLTQERDRYRDALQSYVTAQFEGVPEHIVELLQAKDPVEQLDYLSKHRDSLVKGKVQGVPDTPAANGTAKLTPEERRKKAAIPGRDY